MAKHKSSDFEGQRILFIRLLSSERSLLRVVAACLMLFSLIMFFISGAKTMESWENIKIIRNCLQSEGNYFENKEGFLFCQDNALKSLNIYVRPLQKDLTYKQIFTALFMPIAELFFWAAIFLLSLGLYQFRKFVLPILHATKEIKQARK